jgi:hypothetical protein
MKIIIISIILLLAGCGTSPKDNINRELGWNKALNAYNAEIDKCTPNKLSSCILTSEKTEKADKAILIYQASRTTCLTEGKCDVCQLASAVSSIASVIGQPELVDLGVCITGTDIDDILAELEDIPNE